MIDIVGLEERGQSVSQESSGVLVLKPEARRSAPPVPRPHVQFIFAAELRPSQTSL